MSKKQYQKLQSGYVSTIVPYGADKAEAKIIGWNPRGTMVQVTLTLDDYDLPRIIEQVMSVGKNRVNRDNQLMERMKNCTA